MSILLVPDNIKYDVKNVKNLHLGKLCLDNMKRFGNRTNQINFTCDISESHASVRSRCIRVAQNLRSQGLAKGEIIILCAPNHNDVAIPLVSGFFLGAPVLSMAENQTENEWCHMLGLCVPKIIFCQSTQIDIIEASLNKLRLNVDIVLFDKGLNRQFKTFDDFLNPSGSEDDFEVTEIDPEKTTAVIACTSGTSGLSKGVCITHKQLALMFQLPLAGKDLCSRIDERVLTFSNLFWVSGVICVLFSCIYGQVRLQTPLRYTPELAFLGVEKYKATQGVFSVPVIATILAHPKAKTCDWTSLKMVYSIGSHIAPKLHYLFKEIAPKLVIRNTYALSECAGPPIGFPDEEHFYNGGKIVPWMEWKIVHPETDEILGPNQHGELLLRGPTVFHEYINDPVSTKNAFTEDGWLKTGDVMYFDEKKCIHFVERKKEMFKYHSYQIAPSEIEILIRSLDGVANCCVVGKSVDAAGDVPLAFVEKRKNSKINVNDVKDLVKEKLSDWKKLRGGVVFMDKIPTTHTGKVDRKLLKNRIEEFVAQ